MFPYRNSVHAYLLPHTRYMPRPSHSLDFITRTIFVEEYRSLSSSLRSFLHSHATSSLVGPNIPLSTLFSNTLSLRSSLNVSDQVSHPYKTAGSTAVLYILIFIFVYYRKKVLMLQVEMFNVQPRHLSTVLHFLHGSSVQTCNVAKSVLRKPD